MSRRKHNRNVNQTQQHSDEYKMVYGDNDTVVRTLPLGSLCIEPEYQRRLNMSWAQWIADHFKPHLVEVLQVSFRDGRYWVFNGQHTMTALKIKFQDDNLPVTCKIYRGLTKEDEARLFYDFNTSTRKISSEAMLKARNAYGDKAVRDFLFTTRDEGFIIDPDKSICCKYGIQAVETAFKCYGAIGADKYRRVLRLIKDTWEGERWAVAKNMLNAVSVLVRVYGELLDDKRFITKFKTVSQNRIEKEAGDYRRENRRVPVAYALAMVDIYNRGLGKNKKLKFSYLLDE